MRPSSLTTGIDLGPGAREEALVGAPDVVAGHVRLADRDPELRCDREDGPAGDALQGALRRGRGDQISPLWTMKTLSAVHSAT